MKKTVYAADLFCGGGGSSTGLAQACKALGRSVELLAVNHWKEAVDTHAANHPWATHLCQNIETVNPRTAVPGGHLDILLAGPECIWHSRAAGRRPVNDQRRSSPWQIIRWLELLRVDALLIENVPEFQMWGPLNSEGYPIRSQRGRIYRSFLSAIRGFGYNLQAKVLNSADYGAPTSRSRLFIQARRGRRAVSWPTPTHSKKGVGARKWVAAREIIDWSLKGESIFGRKRPLSPRTVARIIEGLRRFGGPELQPFIVLMEHGKENDGSIRIKSKVKSIEEPLPTITTTRGGSMALVDPQPFILSQGSNGAPRPIDEPMPTIMTAGAHALILPMFGERPGQRLRVKIVDEPLDSITSHGAGALADAFILPVEGYYQRGENSHNPPRSPDEPLGAITQRGYGGIVQPFLIQFHGTSDAHINGSAKSLENPLPSQQTSTHSGVVEPFLTQYNGCSPPQPVTEPLPTVSTKDRFALVQPVIKGRALDIRFRMLRPHELAAAMGFPRDYQWTGTQTEIVKMIGNAIQVDIARALCTSLLTKPRGRLLDE